MIRLQKTIPKNKDITTCPVVIAKIIVIILLIILLTINLNPINLNFLPRSNNAFGTVFKVLNNKDIDKITPKGIYTLFL